MPNKGNAFTVMLNKTFRKGDANMITNSELNVLRKQFPTGYKVRLIKMDDPFAPPIGTTGIVKYVDDIGTIHVKWENGSGLGVVYGEDVVKRC